MNLQDIAKQVKKVKVPLVEEDILDFLKITRRWQYRNTWGHPSIEMIDSIGRRQSERFFDTKGELIYDIWKQYYDKGFTFILTNILDLTKELREIDQLTRDQTGWHTWGNFYFSKPGRLASFGLHEHDYAVIVKQIYGNSHWQVGDKKFILKPDEVCVIPEKTKHMVYNKNENKLSLTINLE
tara:strand:+ start:518 stop:1063 length:546 start_codon:yes stop_codon:yes gene_type:complete